MIGGQREAKREARGRTEGQAAAVVGVLEARFKSVPFDLIKAIQSMHDSDRLSIMVALAATTSSLDQFRAEAGL